MSVGFIVTVLDSSLGDQLGDEVEIEVNGSSGVESGDGIDFGCARFLILIQFIDS